MGTVSPRAKARRAGGRPRRVLATPLAPPRAAVPPPAAPPSARPEAPGPWAARRLSAQQCRESLGCRPGATEAVASPGPGKVRSRRAPAPGVWTHGGSRGAGFGPGVRGRRPAVGAAGAEGRFTPRWVPWLSGCTREGGPPGHPEALALFWAWLQDPWDPGGSGCKGPGTSPSPPGHPVSKFASGPLELCCRVCGRCVAPLRPGALGIPGPV